MLNEAKNNYEKKYQIMINNIRFKIIAGKINKIPEFYTIFVRKMPNYIIGQRDRGQTKAKILASRPLWPRGLTSLKVPENLVSSTRYTGTEAQRVNCQIRVLVIYVSVPVINTII